MLVPKLRFKEFNDEYKNYEFKDVFEFLTNNSYARNDLNYNNGIYNNLHYGDILIKIDNILDCNKFLLPYINDNIKIKNEVTLKENDIIFADTAEDYTAGKCCEIININSRKVLAGLHTIPCRKKITVGKKYLGFYLNSYKFHKQLLPLITGTKVYGISKSTIVDTTITLPNNKIEEEKIADFLSLIDKKIELQSKKIEALKLYSESTKNNFFDSILNCELISLKKILKERKTFSQKGLEYPHVTLSKDGIYDKGERYNRDFLVKSEDKKYKITFLNDLCYNPANLKFGVICLNEYGSAIFSPIYVTYEINKNINPNYIAYYLTRNVFIKQARKYEQGTVFERMSVSPEDFVKFKVPIPSRAAQDQIVEHIKKINNKLLLEEDKLQLLIKYKKGLMQKMFV